MDKSRQHVLSVPRVQCSLSCGGLLGWRNKEQGHQEAEQKRKGGGGVDDDADADDDDDNDDVSELCRTPPNAQPTLRVTLH